MRKNRWISVSLALVLGFAAVASAACTQEPTEPLTKTAYPFRDLSAAFIDEETQSETPQIVTYFKQGSSIPYVGVEAFFAALHGWSEMPDLGNVVSEAESSYILYNKKDATDYILADWKEDTLSVSSTEFLQMAAGESTEGSYVDSTAVLSTWETGDQGTTFDLGAYGFDILYADGQLLLPVCIANLLFCSTRLYNVYFNGEEYFGMSQSDANSFSAARWEELRTCDWNNTTASAEMRQTTVNFLNFALDSFYG